MKRMANVGLSVMLVMVLVAAVAAESEMTITGRIMCAKCALKNADATKCQDVLVVKDESGAVSEYYIEKNDVAEKFGHVCQGEKNATVTGMVTEKDGKKWISPSTIEEAKG